MQDQRSKSELLSKIQTEHTPLEILIALLTEEQMIKPETIGAWSVKDVLAHLTYHEQHMLHELDLARRGELPPKTPPSAEATTDTTDTETEDWPEGVHQLNAHIFLEHKDQLLLEVLANFHRSFQQVCEAVEMFSEEDLLTSHDLASLFGEPLYDVIGGSSYEHYSEHVASIQAWISKQA
jgi:hypothetical protein